MSVTFIPNEEVVAVFCIFWSVSPYTAILRKVVGKGARDKPEWYCGWFLIHCFSKKFQTMAREAMDVCLRVLKESNKSRFDSYSVRKSVLIISHITFRDCRVHSFSDNISRNSCIYKKSMEIVVQKRDKTSAVSVIHVYLRSTDLIFLLATNHFSYSRSMI